MNTIFSKIHPYPAMVNDKIAMLLASQYIKSGMNVLDPFCGSGRLLAAASHFGGICYGIDVNPLACLISLSKCASPSLELLESALRVPFEMFYSTAYTLKSNRKVEWFSPTILQELFSIVDWINKQNADFSSKVVLSIALSATARAACFCRKSGWKLHRMNIADRESFDPDVYKIFKRYVSYYLNRVHLGLETPICFDISLGAAEKVLCSDSSFSNIKFDFLITSPPYGDSISTVQYGGMSSLCLDIVSNIHGLESYYIPGRQIDNAALGATNVRKKFDLNIEIGRYWLGQALSKEEARVQDFFVSFKKCLSVIVSRMKSTSKALFIVGNRNVGGCTVQLDCFTNDVLSESGYKLQDVQKRTFPNKSIPFLVNRFGRSKSAHATASGLTKTISNEYFMLFSRN